MISTGDHSRYVDKKKEKKGSSDHAEKMFFGAFVYELTTTGKSGKFVWLWLRDVSRMEQKGGESNLQC